QRGGGAVNHGQPPCWVGHPRPGRVHGPLQGGGRLWAGPTHKGWLPAGAAACRGNSPQGQRLRARRAAASPQGQKSLAARRPQGGRLYGARKGLPLTTSNAACRGCSAGRRGGRPLVGQLLVGKDSRRLRRGSGDDGAEGARGKLWFLFVKRTILPLEFRKF
ncbi:hypothetical protein BHM03_00040966, partial [Ensete ventricosum]